MDPKVFGLFIQSRRKDLGITQNQLSEKLHVTAKAVSRWERGVGFPSIELLQPLADALGLTIAELMQSKLLEAEIPKEEAAQLVVQTMDTIRLQEALTWKRKLILYGGYVIFFLIYLFLYMFGWDIRFESRLTGTAVSCVGVFIWHFSSRALYSLVTGEPFFVPRPKKKWQHHVAVALFFLGIILLLLVLSFVEVKPLRDSLAMVGLMLAFISGCYVTVFEEELNK